MLMSFFFLHGSMEIEWHEKSYDDLVDEVQGDL